MTAGAVTESVFVEAPARLHFGVLDLRGSLGRWFGGIGVAAPEPTLLLSASASETVDARGEDADRAASFARRFLAHHGLPGGALICVHRSLPAHAGLGSGTQLGLAVARALAELHGVDADPPALARAVGRGERSAIGTWTFAGGGLVVEGGRRPDQDGVAPLLARLPLPAAWRCVVAVPHAATRISGTAEAEAFAGVPPPPATEAERVAHIVMMGLLPALAEGDLATFGASLSAIQRITGAWFAPVQGGTFAPGATEDLIRRMTEWGAVGVGQSSWGPAVYGIIEGEERSLQLASRVRALISQSTPAGVVYEGPFRREGARVWRDAAEPPCLPEQV